MTIDQPSILAKSGNLWNQQQELFLKAFDLALQKLQSIDGLPEQEIDLNRMLYGLLKEAVHELDPDDNSYHTPISPEACNPPDPDDEIRSKREFKRPDFHWGYRDTHAEQIAPRYMWKSFVVECKRLGHPERIDWVFNRNYITNGVCRFMEEQHGYGKSAATALMIGYVQTMELPDILTEVNQFGNHQGVTEIALSSGGWQGDGVSSLGHQFERPFQISPFYLKHMWVDIRETDNSATRASQVI